MPPPIRGDHRLTAAERQARLRKRKADQLVRALDALERVLTAKTKREADAIAAEALR